MDTERRGVAFPQLDAVQDVEELATHARDLPPVRSTAERPDRQVLGAVADERVVGLEDEAQMRAAHLEGSGVCPQRGQTAGIIRWCGLAVDEGEQHEHEDILDRGHFGYYTVRMRRLRSMASF